MVVSQLNSAKCVEIPSQHATNRQLRKEWQVWAYLQLWICHSNIWCAKRDSLKARSQARHVRWPSTYASSPHSAAAAAAVTACSVSRARLPLLVIGVGIARVYRKVGSLANTTSSATRRT